MILVYLGRWSYGRFQDDNHIFYKMKNDLTTGTWQDNIWCPIIIILFCTSDILLVFKESYTSKMGVPCNFFWNPRKMSPENMNGEEGGIPSKKWVWCKPPRKVSYNQTFGAPDQGQKLDVWESQTTESALRWQGRHIAPRHILKFTLEVTLEHVLGIKTMTWIFNPGSGSKSLFLPRN